MSTALDKVHRAKVETLLGERGQRADSAVRFRDINDVASAIIESKALQDYIAAVVKKAVDAATG